MNKRAGKLTWTQTHLYVLWTILLYFAKNSCIFWTDPAHCNECSQKSTPLSAHVDTLAQAKISLLCILHNKFFLIIPVQSQQASLSLRLYQVHWSCTAGIRQAHAVVPWLPAQWLNISAGCEEAIIVEAVCLFHPSSRRVWCLLDYS